MKPIIVVLTEGRNQSPGMASLRKQTEDVLLVSNITNQRKLIEKINNFIGLYIKNNHAVLIVHEASRLSADCIAKLLDVLGVDPFYGFVIPRTADGGSAPVPPILRDDLGAASELLLRLAPRSAEGVVTDIPILIHSCIFESFGFLDESQESLASALALLFIRSNRCGYRAVIANHILMASTNTTIKKAEIQEPDFIRADAALQNLPEKKYEELMACHFASRFTQCDVLFDIRNIEPRYNGVSQHLIALLQPLIRFSRNFHLNPIFWVSAETIRYHKLEEIAPGKLITQIPQGRIFSAAIRLSQFWSFSELEELSQLSSVVAVQMLDTIAWDCLYIRHRHLDGLWRATAKFVDGLIFNSRYTKALFLERFPVKEAIALHACPCSLDARDYASKIMPHTNKDPFILILGNQYEHKGMREAVEVLAASLPDIHIKVCGYKFPEKENLESFASGNLSNDEINVLYQSCRCLVFPSFYEGFGLPVLAGLANNKPVIARDTELLDEIIVGANAAELIFKYSTNEQMITHVREQYARPSSESHLKKSTKMPLWNWNTAAKSLLRFTRDLIDNNSGEGCRQRLELFYGYSQMLLEKELSSGGMPSPVGSYLSLKKNEN